MVSIENFETLEHYTFLKEKIVLSIIWSKSYNEDEKTFKEEESIEIYLLRFIENYWFNKRYIITLKNMSQEFRLKIGEETRDYFVEEIEQNGPMSESSKRFLQL